MTAQRYITTERLDIYKKNLKVKPSQVMAAYHWNKALAGALLPAMQWALLQIVGGDKLIIPFC